MEKKLADFRAKKQREEIINNTKAKIKEIFTINLRKRHASMSNNISNGTTVNLEEKENLLLQELNDEVASNPESEDENIECFSYIDLIHYALWFTLWLCIYVVFIKLQFGTVYLIISGIIGMYINTRTGPKKVNEISAYSVFNKNCESIQGTLKGEQLEKEMGYKVI